MGQRAYLAQVNWALLLAMAVCVSAWALAIGTPTVAWAYPDGRVSADLAASGQSLALTQQSSTDAKAAFTTSDEELDVKASAGQLVRNGTYYLALASNTSDVLGPDGAVQGKSGGLGQTWKLTFDRRSQSYTIRNASTGKVLMAANKAADGSAITEATLVKKKQRVTKSGSVPAFKIPIPTQRWMLKSDRGGYYFVSAANKKMVLDFGGGRAHVAKLANSGKENTRLWIMGASGTFNENGIGSAVYTVKSEAAGQRLGITSSSVAKGAQAGVGQASTIWGEMFEFSHVGGGYYKVTNFNSGLALTDQNGAVRQKKYGKSSADSQLWMPVIAESNGAVQLINKKSGLALAVSGAELRLVASAADDAGQRWLISPTTSGMTVAGRKALHRANKYTSKTKSCIIVDMTAHEFFLFHKANAKAKGAPWVLENTSRCAIGANKRTRPGVTVTGAYHYYTAGIAAKACIWMVGGTWIHSILWVEPGGDNQLGWNISQGCVRIPYKNADYVYKHTKLGTRVVRYYR